MKPITQLGGDTPRKDSFPGLTISERTDTALASLSARQGKPAQFQATAKAFFGFDLPGAGRVATGGVYTAIWTGQDQWFIEAPFASHEDIAPILKKGFGDTASITEQTDGWGGFDLQGQGCITTLEILCNLDLGKMAADSASRTVIEHLGCILICRETGQHYTVYGGRSSAASLHHALVTAARSAL
nr:sarcosine oxidase, gamma subunit [Pseudogemmobacter hezensis]